jgi:hypothetical protein
LKRTRHGEKIIKNHPLGGRQMEKAFMADDQAFRGDKGDKDG